MAREQGDYERAAQLYAESLALQRDLQHTVGAAGVLSNLGIVAAEQGNYRHAATLFEESLTLRRDLQDERGTAISLLNLAGMAHKLGDYGQMQVHLRESLPLFARLGDTMGVANSLHSLGEAAYWQGHLEHAVRLHGAAAALRDAIGAALPPDERPPYETTLASMRTAVGAEVFTDLWAAGQALSPEEAIAYARAADAGVEHPSQVLNS